MCAFHILWICCKGCNFLLMCVVIWIKCMGRWINYCYKSFARRRKEGKESREKEEKKGSDLVCE